jgi:hypothetical protein
MTSTVAEYVMQLRCYGRDDEAHQIIHDIVAPTLKWQRENPSLTGLPF